MNPVQGTPAISDEELMRQLADGRQEALGPLYSRYARLIYSIAAQSLDPSAAEEIVQDVFLTVWRKVAVFAPERGSFRPWVLQIAHYRILNELRRRSRQPQVTTGADDVRLDSLPDLSPEPDEAAWSESLRAAVRLAIEDLPTAQREALDLAFFEDKTHEEVAAELHLPLGTAKTRIRSGLLKLRGKLAAIAVGFALAAILATGGVYRAEQAARQRDERALALVTSSTTEVLHLTAAPAVSPQTHGAYRGHHGAPIAVLTASNLPLAPAGHVYQVWVQHQGVWRSLGMFQRDAQGSARLIAEGPELAVLPDAVSVTVEPSGGSPVPSGPLVIYWSAR